MKKENLERVEESAAPPKPRRKLKHTAAPWEVFHVSHGRGKWTIAVMKGLKEVIGWTGFDSSDFLENALGNATLIAAAPELLTELEHAHGMIKHYLKCGYLPHMSAEEAEQLVRNTDSVILKARGGR